MSDWNRGEEFHLELDAKVTARDPYPAVFVEVQADGYVFRVPIALLNKRATKVQRPFEFGDLVNIHFKGSEVRDGVVTSTTSSDPQCPRCKSREQPGVIQVFQRDIGPRNVPISMLTLMDPQEDSDE